jgi:hypothetical protein
MALKKAFELDSGVTVEYWRIVGLAANLVRGRVLVELLAWRSAAARNNGKQPVNDSFRTIELAITAASDLRLSALYQQLATQQVIVQAGSVTVDPGSGQTVTRPAVTAPGFLFGAEDV